MSVKLMNLRVKVRALGQKPGARDSPQRNQGTYSLAWSFPHSGKRDVGRTGDRLCRRLSAVFPPTLESSIRLYHDAEIGFPSGFLQFGAGEVGRKRQGLL